MKKRKVSDYFGTCRTGAGASAGAGAGAGASRSRSPGGHEATATAGTTTTRRPATAVAHEPRRRTSSGSAFASCPCCGASFALHRLGDHLDACLQREQTAVAIDVASADEDDAMAHPTLRGPPTRLRQY